MTAPDWIFLLMGTVLIYGGWRSIRNREANTEVGEFEGESAVRLGWFWMVFGALFWIAVILDIKVLKTLFEFFMKN